MTTTSLLLLAVVVIANTATPTVAVSPKACRRKAGKASDKYIDCYLKAEEKNAKQKKFNQCEKKFRKSYKKVSALDGCTSKVITKIKDLVPRIEADCFNAGYDGDYCKTLAGQFIDVTTEPPDVFCTEEALECPYGEDFAVRDFNRDCEFTPCCCDPQLEPGTNDIPEAEGGHVCCPNGEWSTGGLGDGMTFFCMTEEPSIGLTGPFGRKCEKSTIFNEPAQMEEGDCDPAEEPGTNGLPFCSDGYICCPSGEWSCGIGDGTFPC